MFADIFYDYRKTSRIATDVLGKVQSAPVETEIGEQVLTGKVLANEFDRHFFLRFVASDSVTFEELINTLRITSEIPFLLAPQHQKEFFTLQMSLNIIVVVAFIVSMLRK